MVEAAKNLIHEKWTNWFDTAIPQTLDAVKIAGSSLSGGRVVFLFFKDSAPTPCIVLKAPRKSEEIEAAKNEFNVLSHVRATPSVISSTPRPLWCGWIDNDYLYLETAISGKLFGNMRSPWLKGSRLIESGDVRRHFKKALGWLAEFQLNTKTCHAEFNEEVADKIIRDSVWPNGEEQDLSGLISDSWDFVLQETASSLSSASVPLVCEHGDFWAGNLILQEGQQIGVTDWADAALQRIPFYDAFFFVVSYCFGFLPKNNDPYWMFDNLMTGRNWFADIAYNAIRDYCSQIGNPVKDYRVMFGLAVLRRTIIERKRADGINNYEKMLERWWSLMRLG